MADSRDTRVDHYQRVTDQVIAALERGTAPWRRPWDPAAAVVGGLMNPTTGRNYRGINVLLLGCHPKTWETRDPRWCSYKQAAEKGWQVRKGERATTVFFFTKVEPNRGKATGEKIAEEMSDEATRLIPVLRAYPVFHVSQIDGVPTYTPPTAEAAPWRRPEAVDEILRNSGISARIGGTRAFYSPNTDHIQLPPEAVFSSRESWTATALHELGHATGHPSRLNRDLRNRFGCVAYAQEELRAELASMFMAGELGIPADLGNHASYLDSWLEVLRRDKREIFRAAGDAQKIADFCLALHPAYRERVGVGIQGKPDVVPVDPSTTDTDTVARSSTSPTTVASSAATMASRRRTDSLRPIAEAMPDHLRRRLGLPILDAGAPPVPDAAPAPIPAPVP